MKRKRLFTGIFTGLVLASSFIFSASADLSLTPDNMQGLTFVSNEEKEVKFKTSYYDGVVGGEDSGAWILGGDNGDTGISIDTLKQYNALEIDYECDYAVDGVTIGFAFKVHISEDSRLTDEGGYVFNDYLPATWVPYGPQGENGKGVTVNSLDTIYQTYLLEKGTISIPTATLLETFDEDSDYLMGIGIGVFHDINKIPEDEVEDAMPYTISVTEIRLADEPNTDAGVNINLIEDVSELESETETIQEEEETEAPIETTTEGTTTSAVTNEDIVTDNTVLIVIICLIAAVIIAVIIIMVISSKKKK